MHWNAVKRGCQKAWSVLDYSHSRTVKGKNSNGIKALRKKAEVLGPESKALQRASSVHQPPARLKTLDDLSRIRLHEEHHSLISEYSSKIHFKTSFTPLMFFYC